MKTFLVLLLLMLILPGPAVQAMPEPAPVAQIAVPSATPRFTATPWPTLAPTRAPTATATMTVFDPAVSILSKDLPAYVYHLDSQGRRVFVAVEPIPKGRLIKVATCLDGYSQIEYQPDMKRPGAWKIVYAKMDVCK